MSHELRTPLNSLLILSDQLSRNVDGKLTPRQVEFARTVHDSGNDLLALINDILDLSKIESGTVVVDIGEYAFADLSDYVERTFRPLADQKRLEFELEFSRALPRAVHTDAKRLQQVLKNLLSNAFKCSRSAARSLGCSAARSSSRARPSRALRMGATRVFHKPLRTRDSLDDAFAQLARFVTNKQRRVLLVDPDEAALDLSSLLGGDDIVIEAEATGSAALAALGRERFDLAVLGMELQDMRAFHLIDSVAREAALADMPLLVYAPGTMAAADAASLVRLAQSLVLKRVRSREQLFDEAALFLHRPVANMPADKRRIIEQLHQSAEVLAGKRVLIVDNDIRNIFALATILDGHGMKVSSAETGREAIELLQATPAIDVVLMDIMLPEMDGYDTMRAIRKDPAFQSLPIITVTAMAQKGDREKCFEAGTTDYISKPVDPEQLVSMLRAWLHR
jgi:CheY-like chemotaxis protein